MLPRLHALADIKEAPSWCDSSLRLQDWPSGMNAYARLVSPNAFNGAGATFAAES
jgi:hypothetical protein